MKEPTISIGEMQKEDKPKMMKIISESPFCEITEKRVDVYLKKKKYLPFMLKMNSEKIGFSVIKKKPLEQGLLEIPFLGLGKKYRGKGIGTKAVLKVISMAKKEFGIKKVRVKIETKNKPALIHIKKAGFTEKKGESNNPEMKVFYKRV